MASFEEALEEDRTRRAVELCLGPFLDGFYIDGSPEFEKWTDGERRRLATRSTEPLETLATRAPEEPPTVRSYDFERPTSSTWRPISPDA